MWTSATLQIIGALYKRNCFPPWSFMSNLLFLLRHLILMQPSLYKALAHFQLYLPNQISRPGQTSTCLYLNQHKEYKCRCLSPTQHPWGSYLIKPGVLPVWEFHTGLLYNLSLIWWLGGVVLPFTHILKGLVTTELLASSWVDTTH